MTRGGCATNCVVPQAVSASDSSAEIRHLGDGCLDLFLGDMEIAFLFGQRGGVLDGLGRGACSLGRRHLGGDHAAGVVRHLRVVEAEPHERGGHDDQDAYHLNLEASDSERAEHVTPS